MEEYPDACRTPVQKCSEVRASYNKEVDVAPTGELFVSCAGLCCHHTIAQSRLSTDRLRQLRAIKLSILVLLAATLSAWTNLLLW